MRRIGERLKGLRFSEERADGFILDRVREDLIEGKFFQKFLVEENSGNPFEAREVFETVRYRTVEFSLSPEFPGIELRNGSRGVRDFANRLLEACDFDLSIQPISVDLLDWISVLQAVSKSKLIVDSLQISGITFEQGISGKILLRGDRDVRGYVDQLLGSKPHLIEKAQIRLKLAFRTVCLQISSNASAKVPDDATSAMLPILRESLKEAARSSLH